jgi:hypothetical protein
MPERWRRILLLLALLPLGALLSHVWVRPAATGAIVPPAALLLRPMDLTIQLGLMLVAALGIRALLPGDNED